MNSKSSTARFTTIFVTLTVMLCSIIVSVSNGQSLYPTTLGQKANTALVQKVGEGSNNLSAETRNAVFGTVKQSSNRIWFEKNAGQFNNTDVLYGFRTHFGSMGVYNNKIRLVSKQADKNGEKAGQDKLSLHIVDITFQGSNPTWTVEPGSKSSVTGSYYTSADKDEKPITPSIYNEITLKNVYPGIDLRLYSGQEGTLEFDWLVSKASDYEKIKMNFNGQDGLKIDESGNLSIKLRYDDMKIVIPETYQVINGNKNILKTRMEKIGDGTLCYKVSGDIHPDMPMVIDPVMIWSTFMNDGLGSGFDEYLYAIASNPAGQVYCAGQTNVAISVSYMSNVSAGYSNSFPGASNANYTVLYELNATGMAILAWTMTGAPAGSYTSENTNVVVSSMDIFPNGRVLICYSLVDLVQIFSNTLAARIYSGSVNPVNPPTNASYQAVRIVNDSTFYISGTTTTAYPLIVSATAPDPLFAGSSEGIIMRVGLTGLNTPAAVWGTYVGGSSDEKFAAIALSPDKTKLAFAVHSVVGTGYPLVVNAVKATPGGTTELLVGVIPVSATPQTAFSVFSYLGGSSTEGSSSSTYGSDKAVVCADNNYFYVGGNTSSTDLVGVTGSVQPTLKGGIDQFISRIPMNGSASIAPNTISIVAMPNNGTVTGVNARGCITFVPNAITGIDSFTYKICDSTSASFGGPLCSTAKVYVNVNPLNHKPVVTNTTATVLEDSSVNVCPTISDPDPGQTATIASVCTPAHGTAVINGACVDYTPTPLYYGADSFCIVVCDNSTLPSCTGASTVLCDTTIIHINVTHVPHCPIAVIDYAIGHDTVAVVIDELANDYYIHAVGSGATVTIVSGPAAGNTATVNANGTITYTAGAGYLGVDTIVYRLTDNIEGCDSTAKIIIYTVDTCVGPKLFTSRDSVCENNVLVSNVLSNAFVGNTGIGSFTIVKGGDHGLTVIDSLTNNIVYQPNANYFGFDTILYKVCDRCTPTSRCATGDLIVSVLYTNHTPIADDDTLSMYENQRDTINVLDNDATVDSMPLTVSISAQPGHGSLTLWNNQLIYTPDPYFCGPDSFGYKITEPSGNSLCSNPRPWDLGLVFVNVICVNNPPYIPDTIIHIPEDTTPVSICVPFVEHQQGQTDSITSICQPSHGTITGIGISNVTDQVCLTYQVDSNFVGVDSICVVICNNGSPVLCDTSHITIVVYPILVAVNDSSETGCHTPVVICVKNNDYSQGNMPFNVTGIPTPPAHGTATIDSATQCVTYNPDGTAANFPGGIIDSFKYTIRDTRGATSSAWVYVKVICCSIHAVSDTFNLGYGDSIYAAVLRNDQYIDSFPHTLSIYTLPQNGTVSVVGDSTIKYVPNKGYCGVDVFKYILKDLCGQDTAMVQITISCDSNCQKPLARNDSVSHGYVCGDTINVMANDTFAAGAVVTVIKAPLYGIATVVNNNVVYAPDGNHPNTMDSLEYSLCNLCGKCDTATVLISLSGYPCNVHHPIVVNDTISVCKNTAAYIHVLDNDYDPDGGTVHLSGVFTSGSNGSVSIYQDSIMKYQPNTGFVGKDTFAYQACDNGIPNLCNTAIVVVNVLPCLPPPIVVDTTIRDTTIACSGKTFCIDSIYEGAGYTVHFGGFCDSAKHGTVILSSDSVTGLYGTLCFTYTPTNLGNPDSCYVGNDTMCLIICNTGPDTVCTTTHVIITILPYPSVDTMWAHEDVAYTCNQPVTISVLNNDGFLPRPGNNITGTFIQVSAVGAAAGGAPRDGTVTIGAGDSTVIYVPNANFVGIDTFKYVIVKNGIVAQYDTATVIVYSCKPPLPVAVNDCSDTTTYVNLPGIINVLGNDTLYAANDTIVTVILKPEHGSAVVNANLTITFTPDSGFYGHDSMVYQVCEVIGPDTVCSRASVCINVIDTSERCFFPNGFSPNGDGVNDVFAFPCNSKYPNASMRVFNRWGDAIWESSGGYKNDWNGTNMQGTPVPDGTYYFIYQYNDGSGKSEARFVVVHR